MSMFDEESELCNVVISVVIVVIMLFVAYLLAG